MFQTIKRIYNLCGSFKAKLVRGIIYSSIFAVFNSINIVAILNILMNIDRLTPDVIWKSVVFLVISVVGRSVFKYLICMSMSANGYRVFCEKRIEIGDMLKHAPMGYFSEQKLGQINGALSTSFAELESFSMVAVENIVTGMVQAVCVILFMLCFQWQLGVISIIGLLLSSWVLGIIRKRTDEGAPRREKAKINMISAVIEYIKGISVVKSFGGQPVNDIEAALEENRKAYTAMEKKSMTMVNFHKAILEVFSGIMLFFTAYLMYTGEMTFSMGVMFLISSFIVYAPMENMSNGAFLLKIIDHALHGMEDVIHIPVMDEGNEKIGSDCSIALKNVCFRYDRKMILKDVSFEIPQNSSVAIVGYSGSGKTTICNLIARFFDVTSGEITFGGKNIKDYPCDELLGQISMVFQDVYLFNDTIANNIKFGKPDATPEEVEEAAKKACCYDFIKELPNGFDTVIGEGGATLSGGERQRISIARAILKNSPVVILDEATSSVDPENEHALLQAIQALKKNKTIISIAHRMSTVKNADQIIVLDSGKIAQKGTHEELIAVDGIYKRFLTVREQSAGWQL